jgi:DNA-binding beta-propeller fold protein YncE
MRQSALSGQNKVVVTNYGTVDRDGNRIKVINTQTNKVEKTIDLKGNIKEVKSPLFLNLIKWLLLTTLVIIY